MRIADSTDRVLTIPQKGVKITSNGLGIPQSVVMAWTASRKGSRLMNVSDVLLPSEIVKGLDTEVFGRKEIIHYRETDSTNARARELADQGAPEGTLVVAERQTRGRGRKGRTWFSPPDGGIYAS
jgi:BirA family biotin operon repressor/biotin-[acetyl-CoA-carboxylase] ligase